MHKLKEELSNYFNLSYTEGLSFLTCVYSLPTLSEDGKYKITTRTYS